MIEDEGLARHSTDDQIVACDWVGDCCKSSSFRVRDRRMTGSKRAIFGTKQNVSKFHPSRRNESHQEDR